MCVIYNVLANQVYPTCLDGCPLPLLEEWAQTLTEATGEVHVVIPVCDHCCKNVARIIDYRGLDVISKYYLCRHCAKLTDEQFFGIEPHEPITESDLELL